MGQVGKGAPERVLFTIAGKGTYELKATKLNIPRLGVVTAADLRQMPLVLEELVRINSGAVAKVEDAPEAPAKKSQSKKEK